MEEEGKTHLVIPLSYISLLSPMCHSSFSGLFKKEKKIKQKTWKNRGPRGKPLQSELSQKNIRSWVMGA